MKTDYFFLLQNTVLEKTRVFLNLPHQHKKGIFFLNKFPQLLSLRCETLEFILNTVFLKDTKDMISNWFSLNLIYFLKNTEFLKKYIFHNLKYTAKNFVLNFWNLNFFLINMLGIFKFYFTLNEKNRVVWNMNCKLWKFNYFWY